MNIRVSHTLCLLVTYACTPALNAAIITELIRVNGPASPPSPLPITVETLHVDNDEVPLEVNFIQPFTGIPVTRTDSPVEFVFRANDSGTSGTTEYQLNQWVVNATGIPWPSLRYSLSARSIDGEHLEVPDLDFDWPEKSTPFINSTYFSNVLHLPHSMVWTDGSVPSGLGETTFFAIDVPDIGVEYEIILQLSLALPGDLNNDGFVGIDDLNLVLGNWNRDVPPANPLADPSGDGFVGIDDLNAVLSNWNTGTPASRHVGVSPEPTSTLIWSSCLIWLSCRRRSMPVPNHSQTSQTQCRSVLRHC